ncbi:MAG: DUF2339 domain-containing protein [Candidatus Peribacteraceae bacterium]|nr:DUF2339 domain-containing protein [Candidatus Peribacteraceae bacterium]
MSLYYLLAMGPIFWIIALFYFIGVPIWLIRLSSRIGRLERGGVSAPVRSSVEREEPKPVRQQPQAAAVPRPTAQVKAKGPQKSLEERVGGHLFQWVGIGALVLALLFFLKWSFDNGFIGPTGRTVIGYVLAGCAIAAGDRLRTRYGTWALAFTGGGALGSYIVTWIALHTYHLFPAPIAFAIYILTTLVVCLLAGYYGAFPLAAFGIIGGFVTPLLTGQEGSTTSLLLYILILDLGILALGHVRQWRGLNTFTLIGTGAYELYAYTDFTFERPYAFAFIGAFLALYLLVPLMYNLLRNQKSEAGDLIILLGNALVHFALILLWLGKTPALRETYDAFVSVGFAVLFLAFSSEVYRRNRADTPMVLGCLALTVFFTSLAVPLQLGSQWVPLAWSVEGVFLLWMALTLKDRRIQSFAWIVMILAYAWYLFVPVALNDLPSLVGGMPYQYSGYVVAYLPFGFYLFLGWVAMLLGILFLGLPRKDREEQNILLFVVTGLAVLTVAFGMNLFVPAQSQLTGWQRFTEAAALIGGGYVALAMARMQWKELSEKEKGLFATLGIAVQIITVVYLTDEFVLGVREGRFLTGFFNPYQTMQVGISILWAVYAIATLIAGVLGRWKGLRVFGLALLMLATGKLAIIDFFALGTGARVIGFTVLGALLVGASFLYQRQKDAVKSFFLS